ncbi:MAG: energy-coupling factor transporter ATPase [Clostridia bacterium]|nr:energy-coupling factor transporter ATPase [Clostridia bacterium]
MENYIDFQNVSFTYQSDNQSPKVLKDFNLQVKKGEFLAILGHNGCGKSTVAKLCNAIELPTNGKIYVDGIDTCDEDKLYDIRQRVGVVLQNPDNQIVATIVEDDVAFGPENLGVEPSEIRRRVDEALKCVSMYDFRFFEPHKLSGGQKQRVAIAGIIAMKPECIVFDESTAMLDPRGRAEVMSEVLKLNKELGITVIFITHYMDEAVNADRVVVMDEGKIILNGTPKEVFVNIELLKKVGLDVPEATELSQMLINEGIELPEDILEIEELTNKLIEALEDKN